MPGVLGVLLWVKRFCWRRRWTGCWGDGFAFSRAVMAEVRIWVW